MSDVTRLLDAAAAGNTKAAADLLPLVYDELRKLAAARLASEKPGQTLQATALVHEAYLRLIGPAPEEGWNSRGHFFAAAAEAMRRILVEQARRKLRKKHGGDLNRVELEEEITLAEPVEDLLALDIALSRFADLEPETAKLVTLRFFAGLTMPEAAAALGIPLRSAEREWAYAKSWLHRELVGTNASSGQSGPG